MTDKKLNALAKAAAEFVKAGGKLKIKVMPDICRKCGKREYLSHPSPNWMNRYTCPACGHSVSR